MAEEVALCTYLSDFGRASFFLTSKACIVKGDKTRNLDDTAEFMNKRLKDETKKYEGFMEKHKRFQLEADKRDLLKESTGRGSGKSQSGLSIQRALLQQLEGCMQVCTLF